MEFMNNMRDRLTQAGQTTVQRAKDLSEIAKLNSTISGATKQIDDLCGKIGYEVYNAYKDAPLPEVADMIRQITELRQTIESCKAQIHALNAVETCPQCGAKISKGMVFCSGCGHRLVEEKESVPEQAAFCTNCGARVSADAVFCTSCGHKIG